MIVDGNCRSLKKEFSAVMEDELLNQSSCRLVNEQVQKLIGNGYKSQAFPRDINLFYLGDHSSERIEKTSDNTFQLTDTKRKFTTDEIRNELQNTPERFSPNVILRPLFQQKILPSLAYIGGAGELSYWLQLKTVFEKYNVNFPQLILRNSVLMINSNQRSKMEKLEVSIADLFKDLETLKKEFVLRSATEGIDFSQQKNDIIQQFEKIKEIAKSIDASLVSAIGAEQQKALQSIESIEKRLLRSLKQKNETELNQIEKLNQQLFPDKILQERYDNFSAYYAAQGQPFIDKLVEELNPYQKQFLVIEE